MTKLLHIIATPRQEASRTLQVSKVFLDQLQQKKPGMVIDELDLAHETLPELSMPRVDGKYLLLSGKDLFGKHREAWEEILKVIERFLAADLYLISTPMWNFGVPYKLKHYIDVIVQPKYLFQYTEKGVEGLVKNKKMVVITSRGGAYETPESRGLDHQEPYLRTIFGFVGLQDITFVKAEPMDLGEELQKTSLARAKEAAKAAAKELAEGEVYAS